MSLPNRKLPRLTGFDYSSENSYFVTICTKNKKCLFGTVDALNFYGKIAENELLKIKGVGEKVAQCALLYGFGRMEAFPVDVWVKRIVAELYPNGLPECIKGTEGIAQQYLFHWRRSL